MSASIHIYKYLHPDNTYIIPYKVLFDIFFKNSLLIFSYNFYLLHVSGATIGFFVFDASILNLAYKSPNTSSRHRASSSDPVPSVTHSTELECRSSDISI